MASERILFKIHRMEKGCAPFRAVQGPKFNPFNPLEFSVVTGLGAVGKSSCTNRNREDCC